VNGLTPRRASSPPSHIEPPIHAPNAALLIDFDNVTMGIRSDLQDQLRRLLDSEVFKGKISVQRAYADWRRYPQYIVPLSESSIDLIFAPAFGSNKKNATDIRLAIDALELVFTRPEIGTYILLSGDSDFSSLVLKLKEYGKYVIGVGIRESSSDLLIQNCDEYFSYNELTGLLKEGEVEHRRRDPWELVVEAVTQMKDRDDVMRSDRLKQVMQELDPNFDEKDAGFSRYSKFLAEAQRRGLLELTKMDNGQYEIDLGGNANVPPDVHGETRAHEDSAGRSRRRRGERHRAERAERTERGERGGRSGRAEADGTPAGMTLADAFQLLRRALETIGAVGGEATDAEQTLEQMKDLHGAEDPIFDAGRFQRMLRQAHDAGVIDLAKADGDAYMVRLTPQQEASAEHGADEAGDAEDSTSRSRRSRGGRGRGTRGGRGRGDRREKEPAESKEPKAKKPEPEQGAEEDAEHEKSRRSPRYRRGSRGAAEKPAAEGAVPGPVGGDGKAAAEVEAPPAKKSTRRSVRGRGSSRSARPTGEAAANAPVPHPVGKEEPSAPKASATPARERPAAEPAPSQRPAPKPEAAPEQRTEGEPTGSLLKRMSAALQRAMGAAGEKADEDD